MPASCPLLFKKHLDKRATRCYILIVNILLYIKEDENGAANF